MQTATATKYVSVKGMRMAAPASAVGRLAATLIDGSVGMVLGVVAYFIHNPVAFLVALLGLVVYQTYLLSTCGQTVGKRVMGLKIVTVYGERNGGFVTNVFKRVILNALLCLVPLYALVDICFIFRQDSRCIHDLIAGTKVVHE
jgi:uncharacterized RDD family membrane protein YckC